MTSIRSGASGLPPHSEDCLMENGCEVDKAKKQHNIDQLHKIGRKGKCATERERSSIDTSTVDRERRKEEDARENTHVSQHTNTL